MGGRGGASKLHSGGGGMNISAPKQKGPAIPNAMFGQDPNFQNFMQFMTQHMAEMYHQINNFDWTKWRGLSSSEITGIERYTGSYYGDINTLLREGRMEDPYEDRSRLERWIDGATSALSHFEAKEDFIAFRGASLHWTANLLGGTEADLSDSEFLKSRIGKQVVDKGFMSAGTHLDSKWSSDVDYKIYVRGGIKGMYVDPVSSNSGEHEYLFNRDTVFIVHQIGTDQYGVINNLVIEAVVSKH